MISTADALEVMTIVAACHQRTAPRVDDREVALATASVWAELFNEFDFGRDELIAAVKSRAQFCTEAPEPADIIRVARTARSERMGKSSTAGPTEQADHRFSGDTKATDAAPYPEGWDADHRLGMYWYALRMHALPATTAGWLALEKQRRQELADRTVS